MTAYDVRAGLVEIDEFSVVGLSVVTDHTKAAEDINALWERFFRESIGQRIAEKANDNIYAVYSEYQGDHEAPYRITIGYRITRPETPAPDGLCCVKVADQSYAVLSAAGEQPKALIETWKAVWSGDLPRSFQTDFELYGPRFFQSGLHEILLHVGLKK